MDEPRETSLGVMGTTVPSSSDKRGLVSRVHRVGRDQRQARSPKTFMETLHNRRIPRTFRLQDVPFVSVPFSCLALGWSSTSSTEGPRQPLGPGLSGTARRTGWHAPRTTRGTSPVRAARSIESGPGGGGRPGPDFTPGAGGARAAEVRPCPRQRPVKRKYLDPGTKAAVG